MPRRPTYRVTLLKDLKYRAFIEQELKQTSVYQQLHTCPLSPQSRQTQAVKGLFVIKYVVKDTIKTPINCKFCEFVPNPNIICRNYI